MTMTPLPTWRLSAFRVVVYDCSNSKLQGSIFVFASHTQYYPIDLMAISVGGQAVWNPFRNIYVTASENGHLWTFKKHLFRH